MLYTVLFLRLHTCNLLLLCSLSEVTLRKILLESIFPCKWVHAWQVCSGFSSGRRVQVQLGCSDISVSNPPWSLLSCYTLDHKWMGIFVHEQIWAQSCLLFAAGVQSVQCWGWNGEPHPPEEQKHHLHKVGSVQWASSTFGLMQKSQRGEYELEALVGMPDDQVNLLVLSFHVSPLRLSS